MKTKNMTFQLQPFMAMCLLSCFSMLMSACQMHTQNSVPVAKQEAVINGYQDSLPNATTNTCEDFLLKTNKNHASLSYLGCSQTHHHNIPANVAQYQVKGDDAIKVHQYFQQLANLPVLKKDCCHWSTLYNANTNLFSSDRVAQFIHKENTYYVVMQSKYLHLGWNVSQSIEQVPYYDVFVITPIK